MIALTLRRAVLATACLAAPFWASAANAAIYLFELTGPVTATFTLESSPVPDGTDLGQFWLTGVDATLNGSPTTFDRLTFYDFSQFGGIYASSDSSVLLDLMGAQLFTGPLTNPTFVLGTFELTPFTTNPPGTYTITISDTSGAVPEPATWAMMLMGFGAAGFVMRRHRRTELTFRRAA